MQNIEISQLIRSRRRSIALMVTADAKLTVRAPLYTPVAYIERLVEQKSPWIRRKVAQALERPRSGALAFAEGSRFFYLGQAYLLEVYDGSAIRFEEKLFFPRSLLPQAREEMVFWYRQAAAKVISESIDHYAGFMGVKCREVQLSDASSRWGSCSSRDSVRLNWRLVMAPLAVLDYVVIHELTHLTVRNHSRAFWAKVGEVCPAYREHRAWLRKNQRFIEFGTEKI